MKNFCFYEILVKKKHLKFFKELFIGFIHVSYILEKKKACNFIELSFESLFGAAMCSIIMLILFLAG